MKASELRIGNYTRLGDRIGKVKSIFNTHFQVDDERCISLGNSIQRNFEPIPLTEEWLIKLGFVFDGITNEYYDNVHNDVFSGSICIKKRHGNNKYKWEFRIGCIDIRDFNYVHQLQNLYFALTGKELETKNIEL